MSDKKSDLMDVSGLLRKYAAKWYWFVISIIACCAIGYGITKIIKPKYEVNAKLILQSDASSASKLLSGGFSGVSDLLGGNSNAEDELDILMSHSVLKTVVRDMNLNRHHSVRLMPLNYRFAYDDYPVDVVPRHGFDYDTLRTPLLFIVKASTNTNASVTLQAKGKVVYEKAGMTLPATIKTAYGTFDIKPTKDYPSGKELKTKILLSSYDDAAESLRKVINAGLATKHSQIIELQMYTDNIDYACDLLDKIMDVYNKRSFAEQIDNSSATAKFLADRVNLVSSDLNATEADIKNYKEHKGMTDVTADVTALFEGLKGVEAQLEESEVLLRQQQMVLELAQASAADNSPLPTEGQGALAVQISNYNTLLLNRMQLAESALPDNPSMQAIDKQIATTRDNIIKALRSNVDLAQRRYDEFRKLYDEKMAGLSDIPSQEKDFRAKERDRTVQEEMYVFLLQKQEETAILFNNIKPNGTVIDSAYSLSEDHSTSPLVVMLVAFVFGLMLPPLAFLLLGFMRRKIHSRKDVEQHTELPVVGEICRDRSKQRLVVSADARTATAEAFRLTRANMRFIMPKATDKVVLVTSATSGDGKTFVAANLAASFALMGKRTLLAGMDIRKPRLAKYLGITPVNGLTQYLADPTMTVQSIITHNAVMPGLDVIAGGPVPPNPTELLSSARLDELFEELRKLYDVIIIDAAPVNEVGDTMLLNRLTDATIFVLRVKRSGLSDVNTAASLNDSKRLTNVSLLINGTKVHRKGFGSTYGDAPSK